MRQTFLFLFLLLLIIFPAQLPGFEFEFEDLTTMEKKGNETASAIFANLALFCFIVANVYTLAKSLIKKKLRDRDVKNSLANLLKFHILFNVLMFIFTLLHSHYAESTSVFLILSIIAMICLLINGSFLRYLPDINIQQRQNLLRAKQVLFGTCVFLLVLGHVLVME